MQAEVAELVRQHGFDFRDLQAFQQCVEEYDALAAPDAGEIGVAMHRAARAVHHEDAARGEPAALQQGFGALLERFVAQRRELVEQRRDQRRPCPGDQHRERHPHEPGIQPPQRAGPLHQEQDHEHQRSAEQQSEQQALEQVGDEQADGHAIETEARLDAEGAPERQRQADERDQQERGKHDRRAVPHCRQVSRLPPARRWR